MLTDVETTYYGIPLRVAENPAWWHANLDLVGYLLQALLESRCVTGVRPEHPRPGRLLSSAVAVLDGVRAVRSHQL